MKDLKFTADRPNPNTQEICNQRLLERNLLHGASFVVKVKGRYYGSGDRVHCPAQITHNLTSLLEILKYGGWSYVAKAYDSDMYFSRQKITSDILKGLIQHNRLEYLS